MPNGVTKQHILDEINRTSEANGGVPLGKVRFRAETGIKEADWSGRYWARWGDALTEAGYPPNRLNTALKDDEVLGNLVTLIRGLGHFPVVTELKMKARQDPQFPSHNVFAKYGGKSGLVRKLREYAKTHTIDDVLQICDQFPSADVEDDTAKVPSIVFGFVYLLRSGRYFKIGKSNAVGRRERELAIQLPEKSKVVHSIKTDDPCGIEEYWHKRFADRRKNGEWFELTADDVSAFRRRKFM